jgi:hypothetical protein
VIDGFLKHRPTATTLLSTRGIAVDKTPAPSATERAKGLSQLLAKRPTKEDLEKKQIFFDEKRTQSTYMLITRVALSFGCMCIHK